MSVLRRDKVELANNSMLLSSTFFPSLKLECDKLASEKSEMQRHYIMVSMSVDRFLLMILQFFQVLKIIIKL